MRSADIPALVGDNTKLKEATGWKPEIGIDKTLRDVLDYWRESLKK
jgi:GDP-4-dehydro-6-deoxy-D-mannose reductase